jgi:hypothetical protein
MRLAYRVEERVALLAAAAELGVFRDAEDVLAARYVHK